MTRLRRGLRAGARAAAEAADERDAWRRRAEAAEEARRELEAASREDRRALTAERERDGAAPGRPGADDEDSPPALRAALAQSCRDYAALLDELVVLRRRGAALARERRTLRGRSDVLSAGARALAAAVERLGGAPAARLLAALGLGDGDRDGAAALAAPSPPPTPPRSNVRRTPPRVPGSDAAPGWGDRGRVPDDPERGPSQPPPSAVPSLSETGRAAMWDWGLHGNRAGPGTPGTGLKRGGMSGGGGGGGGEGVEGLAAARALR